MRMRWSRTGLTAGLRAGLVGPRAASGGPCVLVRGLAHVCHRVTRDWPAGSIHLTAEGHSSHSRPVGPSDLGVLRGRTLDIRRGGQGHSPLNRSDPSQAGHSDKPCPRHALSRLGLLARPASGVEIRLGLDWRLRNRRCSHFVALVNDSVVSSVSHRLNGVRSVELRQGI